MKYLMNFNNNNEFQGYIANLREEGKIVVFYVKDGKIHDFYGDGRIHTISTEEVSTIESIKPSDNWILSFKIEGCSSTYNQYGSSVICSNGDPFNVNGFQIYASKDDVYKITTQSSVSTNMPYNSSTVEVELTYRDGRLYTYLSDGTNTYGQKGGSSDKYFTFQFNNNVDLFSYAMPEGMNIKDLKIEII